MTTEQDYPFTPEELAEMDKNRKEEQELCRQAWLDYQGYVTSEEEELPE